MKVHLNDEIRTYMEEVASHDVLTRDEEIELFQRLEAGDPAARGEIVAANLRFVIKMALPFAGRGMNIGDLIQEGNIGLLEVVDKFDWRRGFRFSTYAAFWIRQAIQVAARKHSNVIRIPIRKSRMLGYVNEARRNFIAENGRAPATAELAGILDMDEDKLEELEQMGDAVLSLDTFGMDEESGTSQLLNRLSDDTTLSAFEKCSQKEIRVKVEEALDQLSDRERRIMRLRYGFDTGQELSLRSTSREVGMSQEGVRRIERKALKKLRRPSTQELMHSMVA